MSVTDANAEGEPEVIDVPEVVNPLSMSDEEMMNYTPPEGPSLEDGSIVEDTDIGTDDDGDPEAKAEEDGTFPDAEEAGEDGESVNEGGSDDTTFSDGEDASGDEVSTDDGDPADSGEETPDYKAEYEKLLAPFKASGAERQIDNVDDAIKLMSMGVDYSKKMAGLKPKMKLLKMLENHNLLDEEKLNYLIDLDKKDPGAINKLVKDSGIDPLDVDTSKEAEYQPNTYTVDDAEVALDDVLDTLKSSPTYQETMSIVSTKWDATSQAELYKQPQLISNINDQVASGVYAKVNEVVEKERMLGRLDGLSDIEAYRQVGNAMQAQGAFTTKPVKPAPVANVLAEKLKAKATPKPDPKLAERKRAAGSTKSSAGTKPKATDYDPLAMSDEDFAKVSSSTYL